MKTYYLYILASKKNGTLYTGLTNNLVKRVCEHKENLVPGFTQKYKVHRLVYYEQFADIYSAIAREKRIKKWKRQWKINLIESTNPNWLDLYDSLSRSSDVQWVNTKRTYDRRDSCTARSLKNVDSATSAE